MKKWVIILAITILVAGCGTTGYALAAKVSQLDAANSEITDLSGTITGLESDVSSLEVDKANLTSDKVALEENNENLSASLEEIKSDLDSANGRITSLESSLRTVESNYQAVTSELAELKSFYDGIFKGEPPPYIKPDGELMRLIDNKNAQDPTWQQLVDFLTADQTDRKEYVKDVYVCSGFAEDVHNNAEAAGIRTAIVYVGFEDSAISHVLNAFNTTDRGLVFIDCTGVSGITNTAWDRVAYIRVGGQYGLIHLDTPIQSFEYEFYQTLYTQLQQRITQYEVSVSQYNAEVESYNITVQSFHVEVQEYEAAVEAYNQNPTHEKYVRLTAWYSDLLAEENTLSTWSTSLNNHASVLNLELYNLGLQYDAFGGVLGTVEEVRMYW